jgi:hypothetical protein
MHDAREWAAEYGLNGPLEHGPEDRGWLQDAPPEELLMADALLSSALHRASTANATSYVGRLRTMLHWLALFVADFPHRTLFQSLCGPDAARNAIHNEDTLLMFGQFIRNHGSIAAGRGHTTLRSDSIGGIISTLRAYRGLEARYELRVLGGGLAIRAWAKGLRHEDGPAGERALRLGIRSIDFKSLHDISVHNARTGGATWDYTSRDGIMDTCAAILAHNLVARGGEVGLVGGEAQHSFDPLYGFVISDVSWKPPSQASNGFPWAIVLWFPIKDKLRTHRKHPMAISRRHHGALGSDPQCVYDALYRAWLIRANEIGRDGWPHTAFFASAGGKIYDTNKVRDIAKAIANILGLDGHEFGGTSFRIGGASDLRESHGHGEATRLLRERGRWASDIGAIYSRLSVSTQLSASRAMSHAPGADIERITGWAQQR